MSADSKTKVALLIVGEGETGAPGDWALRLRLEALGYSVVVRFDTGVTASCFDGKALVVVSSLRGTSSFGATLREKGVPAVVADGGTWEALGMVREGRGPSKFWQARAGRPADLQVRFTDLEHSLAAALSGKTLAAAKLFDRDALRPTDTLGEGEVGLLCGRPHASAQRVAWLKGEAESGVLIFAYERGALMYGTVAPERRVAVPVGGDVALAMTTHAWALFDAAVAWAVGEELKQFAEVFTEEWREVRERRQRQRIYSETPATADSNDDVRRPSPPRNLVGLALSGGGIRSATFGLGLMQGMNESRVLRLFDYVSTVSGGGYTGGWWSAWLSRGQLECQDGLAYPLFNASEVKRPEALIEKLLGRGERPDARNVFTLYCRQRISEQSLSLWRRYEAGVALPEEVKANLAKELSKLLAGGSLYKEMLCVPPDFAGASYAVAADGDPRLRACKRPRFCHVNHGRALKSFFDADGDDRRKRLGFETRQALDASDAYARDGFEMMRLNRLLIEDAFPDELGAGDFPEREGIEPQRSEHFLRERRGRLLADDDAAADADAGGRAMDEMKRSEAHAEAERDLMAAGRDPVHHLRLFSNYLTPRKGLMSNDTWRAAAVIIRDLVMTWLILLPVILAAVLLGQLYFVLWPSSETGVRRIAPKHDFVTSYKSEIRLAEGRLASLRERRAVMETALAEGREADGRALDEPTRAQLGATVGLLGRAETDEAARLKTLLAASRSWIATRMRLLMWPLAAVAVLMVLIVSAWNVLNNTGTNFQSVFAGFAVWLIIGSILFASVPNIWVWPLYDPRGTWRGLNAIPFFAAKLALLLTYAVAGFLLWKYVRRRPKIYAAGGAGLDSETRALRVRDVQRNQMVRMQTSLLLLFVVVALVLLVAGFGHEVVQRMFDLDATSRSALVARYGGILTTLLGVAGAIYTAVKATPAGGGDQKETEEPSLKSRVIFAATPPLIIVILFVGAAWVTHAMLSAVTTGEEFRVRLPPLTWAVAVSVVVAVGFAFTELRWRQQGRLVRRPNLALVLIILFAAGLALIYEFNQNFLRPLQRLYPLAFLTLSTVFILLRLSVKEATSVGDNSQKRAFRFVVGKTWLGRHRLTAWQLGRVAMAASLAVIAALVAFVYFNRWAYDGLVDREILAHRAPMMGFALAGVAICYGLTVAEIFRGTGDHRRPLGLIAAANLTLGALLIISLYANYREFPRLLLFHAALGLLATALGWVVALGWLADPNALSLHDFYKARLVRAYLGASNPVRRLTPTDVTDAAEGDDLPLSGLKNCQRGGPYHIVNATLNLAAARDLTTAQRSSAAFVLTKLNCGSSRTGYRRTDRYMSGRLSLGTAVATSGAAASPNMGSRTPSASLAMLMTLLNVRLGYWAPTPNKEHWQLTQAQLWPFYVLREFTSQTNDLSSYCYLTDGGHFDNTGLYSLVERGCRFIVLADAGADPAPCFSDLGDAVRRCRIDFGAEIKLAVEPFFKDEKTKLASAHFVVGEIRYHPEHLKSLGWSAADIDERGKGFIVLFKPSLMEGVTPDVRQYGIENNAFPQQGTTDQWFDESQFESYRQLGQHVARRLFSDFLDGRPGGAKDEEEQDAPAARLRRERAPLALEEIEQYFAGLFERYTDSGAEAKRRALRAELWTVVGDETQRHDVKLTPGGRRYLERLVAEGAAKLGAAAKDSPEVGAAKENLRRIVGEARRRAWCAGTRRIHESVLSDSADAARAVYPFFEKETSGHSNGGGNGGNGRA